jgi:hypothetical protein
MIVSVLHSLRSLVRSRAALHLEVFVLRHQLLVLDRSRRPRLRLTAADRLLWVWLSRVWTRWRATLVIAQPATVVAWHRRGFRLFWTWKGRRRVGRPTVPAAIRALARTMSQANPLWGAPRIHGELQKLGIALSQSTVAKYMVRRRRPVLRKFIGARVLGRVAWRARRYGAARRESAFGEAMTGGHELVPSWSPCSARGTAAERSRDGPEVLSLRSTPPAP